MTLRLPDHWLWDFWFAVDGTDTHVFYLKAPRSLGDPQLRHRYARYGHAVSADLRNWEVLPDPLPEAEIGAFDDQATWTGSILHHDGSWLFAYSGVSKREFGAVQRVGFARSDDLLTWTRQDDVISADPQWYERLAESGHLLTVVEEAWRDPWLFVDDRDGSLNMLVTARARSGEVDARGVIGHVRRDPSGQWVAQPPVSSPGEFFHLEVPQLLHEGGRYQVLFCTPDRSFSAARLARPGVRAESGTHYLIGDSPTGPFTLETDTFLVGDPERRLYAGRIVRHDGRQFFLAWHDEDDDGEFTGSLSDPLPVEVSGNGVLRVHRTPPTLGPNR